MTGTKHPQQFANLVDRAIREGLIARRDRKNPRLALVTSSKDAHTWYRVTRTSCSCKAHQHFGVCKHRALVLSLVDTGRLPFTGTVAPAPVVTVIVGETIPAPKPVCTHCDGRGYQIKARRVGRGEFVREDVPCPQCAAAKVAA